MNKSSLGIGIIEKFGGPSLGIIIFEWASISREKKISDFSSAPPDQMPYYLLTWEWSQQREPKQTIIKMDDQADITEIIMPL